MVIVYSCSLYIVFLCFVLFSLSFFVEFFLYMNKILPTSTLFLTFVEVNHFNLREFISLWKSHILVKKQHRQLQFTRIIINASL